MTMKWEPSAFKNPMARARGLGNAPQGGSHHWMAQKITALANIPLVIWAIYSFVGLAGQDYAAVQDWMATFPNPVLLCLFVISTFYHAALGLQVAIEDYMHCECLKLSSLIGVKLGLAALAFTALFSILKLAL